MAMSLLAAFCASAGNLVKGDTGFETEPDSFSAANLDPGYLPFVWDKDEAFEGKRSIRIDWDRKNRRGVFADASDRWVDNHIGLDSADLENGTVYTISFYAKAEHDKVPLGLWLCPNAAWGYWPKGSNYNRTFLLSKEWRRYTYPFMARLDEKAPCKGYSILFGFKQAPAGKIWFDAVQLEKGSAATHYAPSSPMSCGIKMLPEERDTARSIYYQDEKVAGIVRVASNDGKGGTLTVRTIDHTGKSVSEFKREVKGGEEIPLVFDSKRLGWFKIVASVSRNGNEIVRHTANFIVIGKPVAIASEVEPFFGIIGSHNMLDVMQKLGVKRFQVNQPWGTTFTSGIEAEEGKFDFRRIALEIGKAKTAGMKIKYILSPFYAPAWYFDKALYDEAKKYPHAVNSLITPEMLAAYRKLILEIVDRFGDDIHEFELGAEDNGRIGSNAYYRAKHPDWLVENWVAKGEAFDMLYNTIAELSQEIKKRKPHIKIGVVRPSEGREGDNWIFVEKVFEKIGKNFDIFPIDTYLLNPYTLGPDIKSHNGSLDGREYTWNLLQKFIRKYGKKQPVFISEASLECDTRYPDESRWRVEQAEIMAKDFLISRALGFYAYDLFLAAGSYTVGEYTFNMIQNHRVQIGLAAVAAAARIVENAVETEYIKLPGAARIALFKRHDGTGAAGIWADKGYFIKPPAGRDFEFTDMMGNRLAPSKDGSYLLGSAPIFMTGPKYETLESTIKSSEIGQSDFCNLTFDVRREGTVTFRMENTSTKHDLRLFVEVRSDAGTKNDEFTVPAGGSRIVSFPAHGKMASVMLKRMDNNAVLKKEIELPEPIALGRIQTKFAEVMHKHHILPNEPWTPWSGPEDLSATFSASWDKEYLNLAVAVTDDKHFNNSTSTWNGDSIQVAIDPKSNAGLQRLNPGMLGKDDVEFGIALSSKTGKKFQDVSFGPKNLLTSDDFEVIRDETKKTTLYNVRVSWNKLGVKPVEGMVFSMSLVLFDDDAGTGMEYFAQIGGGITKCKDPLKYLKFVLK